MTAVSLMMTQAVLTLMSNRENVVVYNNKKLISLFCKTYFPPVCLISEYASVTINVYLYSIHLGIWNITAVFQFPFNTHI